MQKHSNCTYVKLPLPSWKNLSNVNFKNYLFLSNLSLDIVQKHSPITITKVTLHNKTKLTQLISVLILLSLKVI